jgi:hypothetical protein
LSGYILWRTVRDHTWLVAHFTFHGTPGGRWPGQLFCRARHQWRRIRADAASSKLSKVWPNAEVVERLHRAFRFYAAQAK